MRKDEAEKRLKEIDEEIKLLHAESHNLQKTLEEIHVAEETERYLLDIRNITAENSRCLTLSADTKTTPIMDAFDNSNDICLIFYKVFTVLCDPVSFVHSPISLIVKRQGRYVKTPDNGLTMTDLKKRSRLIINRNYYNEEHRMYPLIDEILVAAPKISDSNIIVPFRIPVRLGGQTYANQTGYGSEYYGDIQVSQGTLYGETTGFCIGGIRVELPK